jgi:type IV secretory pathway VirB10-like protein
MTGFPDDAPIGDIVTREHPERKMAAASVLLAPRTPVTRWNRKMLLAGAGALAAVVGLGFYLGFGGANGAPKKTQDPQAAADTANPQKPEISNRYAQGYADPAVRASGPGTANLPAPGATSVAVGAAAPATPATVDPIRVQAAALAMAARAAGPFFGGAASQVTADHDSGASVVTASPDATARAREVAEVSVQNGQGEKRQFAASARSDDYLSNTLREPISPWEVKAGTVIPAALITAINSDLPGEVIAQVTEPVYDHATGRTVLIPQGSRLVGQYDSQVAYGQERALIAWNRVIMPNGNSINIGSMGGADLTGASGLRDRVDDHFGQLAKGILVSTLFSVGAASAQNAGAQGSGNLVIESAGSGVANNAQEVGQRITERDLSRQPTITVRAGWPLRVLVNKDIILAPYQ